MPARSLRRLPPWLLPPGPPPSLVHTNSSKKKRFQLQPDSCWPFLPFRWVVCIGPSETWRPVLKLILNDIRSKVKLVWFDRRPSRWQTEKHHTSRICARLEVRRHLVSFQKSYGVGNARVSVMAACGQARDGVVEAVLTCQVGEHSDQILLMFHPTSQIFL